MVLKEMEPIEVFNLSVCSKKSTRRLQIFSKRLNADACYIYLFHPVASITITFKNYKKDLKWVFDGSEHLTKKHVQETKVLSGHSFKTTFFKETPNKIMCRNANILESFPIVLQHFLDIFIVSLHLIIEPHLGDLEKLFDLPLLSTCAGLEFTRGYRTCFFLPKVVEQVCSRVKVKTTLKVGLDSSHNHLRRQVFNVENLILDNATWMGRSEFMRLDCRNLIFHRHSFDIKEIEMYALMWQHRIDKPKLERMEFGWEPHSLLQFEVLKTMKWDPKRRSKRCLKYDTMGGGTIDCSEAFDFVRKDGLLASIGMVDCVGRSFVIFHVWHDPFPTKRQEELLEKRLVDLVGRAPEINRMNGVGGVAEGALLNPRLSSGDFQNLLHETYAHRLGLFGSSPQLDAWFNFHNQILHVKRELEYYC
ncbi:hypothetical protein CAEBREN_05013 [Caenorhabditis brenneri]|uniref:F-box associated domain-containing protein n=1 Tax=Caenorhabditis brenneri TaxID=135651 RepID=G0NJ76_CAEBE|nr:hypothetical protein CAEBREN_05013 [Caenorhabditis brenneri]